MWLLYVEARACWVLPCCGVFLCMEITYKTRNTQVIFIFFTWAQSIDLPFCWCSGADRLSSVVLVLWRNQQRIALLEWLQNQQNAATSLYPLRAKAPWCRRQEPARLEADMLNQTLGLSPPCPSAVRKVTSLKSRAACAKGQLCQGLPTDQGC